MRSLTLASCLIVLGVAPARAGWASVELDRLDRRIMCAAEGKVGGRQVLVLCGENGPLYVYRWEGDRIDKQVLDPKISYPAVVAIGDLRGDGIERLYVGSSLDDYLMEFTAKPDGSWSAWKLPVPMPAVFLSIAKAPAAGKPLLAMRSYRMDPKPFKVHPNGITEHNDEWGTYLCSYGVLELTCERVEGRGEESLLLVATEHGELIASDPSYLRPKQGQFRSFSDLQVRRNIVGSRNQPLTLYLDKMEVRYSETLHSVKSRHPIDGGLPDSFTGLRFGAHAQPHQGAFRSIAPTRLRGGVQERLFVSHMDDHIYEYTRGRTSWKKSDDIGWFELSPDYLVSADLRGDGRERLYVAGNGHPGQRSSGALWEVDYSARRLPVAALNIVVDGAGAAWQAGAQEILGDLFRSELAKAAQLAVIDQEKLEAVRSELKLQESLCRSPECLASLGKPLQAEFIIETRLTVANESLSLKSSLVEVSQGRVVATVERVALPMAEALDGVRELAKAWSLVARSELTARESSRR